jgi:pimeloyl-ACP methyl ester carboxylesterase
MRATFILLLCCVAGCGASDPLADAMSGTAPSADGVTIRYEVHGTGTPAIVLVHGWTNSRGIWGEHPKTLSSTHRVVTLELAGHGESGADRANWTMDAFGLDVVAVVDELGLDNIVLVGFSMGGGVVLEAAERLGDRVLGIVFVDTFKDPDHRLSDAEVGQMLNAFRSNWGDTTFTRAFAFTPDAPDSLIEYVAALMPEQPHEHWFTIFHSIREWMEAESVAALQRAEVPIAAINTTLRPTNVEAMQRYVPSFTVDTISGVGHAGILLRRVDEFDARLRAIIARFEYTATAVSSE